LDAVWTDDHGPAIASHETEETRQVRENPGHEARSLGDYLHVVRRRKWLILTISAAFLVAAIVRSSQQDPLYSASSEVLLSRAPVPTEIAPGTDQTFSSQPDRVAKTEAAVAAVPAVAARVLREARVSDMTVEQFLAHSSATAKTDADLLVLSVRAGNAEEAAKLASEYADQFSEYRKELDTNALHQARLDLEDRIDQLRASKDADKAVIADLEGQAQQLGTAEALATGNTSVIRSPTTADATKIRPRPLRDAVLAGAIGLLLGIVVAFLRDAVDTRIRSADEIGDRLGVPLLARIPEPPRPLQMSDGLVMLADPNGREAEAFRMLRTNLDFVNVERGARTVMVTSASQRDGKSTTVANLAVALARAGKNVVLVDLDLRRPYLHRFFDVEEEPGLTNVVLEQASIDQALSKVWASEANAEGSAAPAATGTRRGGRSKESARATNGRAPAGSVLEIMPSGTLPPNPGEFVSTRALATLLDRLRERADFVLIDAPPMIGIGDAMTISAKVDGIVLVTRMNRLRRPLLFELHRLLGTSPASLLGFVVTGARVDGDHYYASDGYHGVAQAAESMRAPAASAQRRRSTARKRRAHGRAGSSGH
jgi:Mrp family chromosome partitioning ATPase/capsular polysaccharide biosynthesis protein